MTIAVRDAVSGFGAEPVRRDVSFAGAGARGADQAGAPRHGAGFAFRAVGKAFGPKTVIDGLDLKVPAGQFVAIIGKSGCGKSTVLRLLTGLETPGAGEIAIDGGADRARATRVMFQEPRLLPWARVAANVAVGLSHVRDKAQKKAKALALLDEVGLADRAGEWPAVLSGGQRQRVALARALASEPGILALDEPLGALDALTRIEMQMLLERIWRQQGFTAVLVTHDVAEAVALADRVVLIADGRIALDMAVPLERPRRRGAPELAHLEGILLEKLIGTLA